MGEYWRSCIEEAFSDAEIEVTQEKLNIIVEWVEGAHDNYSMATGMDCIPNPMNAEIESLKRKIAKLESEHERQINGVIRGVASRRGVGVDDVTIDDDGLIKYYP